MYTIFFLFFNLFIYFVCVCEFICIVDFTLSVDTAVVKIPHVTWPNLWYSRLTFHQDDWVAILIALLSFIVVTLYSNSRAIYIIMYFTHIVDFTCHSDKISYVILPNFSYIILISHSTVRVPSSWHQRMDMHRLLNSSPKPRPQFTSKHG